MAALVSVAEGPEPVVSPLADAEAALRAAAALDLDPLDDVVLTDGVRRCQRLSSMVAAVQAKLVAQVSRRNVAGRAGATSTGAWLVEQTGISRGEALHQTRFANELAGLPQTREALESGALNVRQARQLAEAAKDGTLGTPEETEAQLLDLATTLDGDEFRRAVRRTQERATPGTLHEQERRQWRNRSARWWRNRHGGWQIDAALDPVSGETVVTALEALMTLDGPDVPEDQRRTPDQRRADALAALATHALDHGEVADAGGERPHVTVVADLGVDGHVEVTSGHGEPWSREALDQLLCDAAISRVVMAGPSELLDAGRTIRDWPPAMRRAIVARDGGCRFPGCDRPPAWCHAHHVRWWERDHGPTTVTNGILLCQLHHTMVHDHHWHLTYDPHTGVVTVRDPNTGQLLTSYPRRHPHRHRRRRPG